MKALKNLVSGIRALASYLRGASQFFCVVVGLEGGSHKDRCRVADSFPEKVASFLIQHPRYRVGKMGELWSCIGPFPSPNSIHMQHPASSKMPDCVGKLHGDIGQLFGRGRSRVLALYLPGCQE